MFPTLSIPAVQWLWYSIFWGGMGIPPTFSAADWDGRGTALAPAAGQAGPAEVQHVQNQEENEGNEWPRLENPLEKHNWVEKFMWSISFYILY